MQPQDRPASNEYPETITIPACAGELRHTEFEIEWGYPRVWRGAEQEH